MAELTVIDEGAFLFCELGLPDCTPDRALQAFTDPAVLTRWWHGELTADLTAGGRYEVWFPRVPARMTGQVTSYEPGRALEFSWAWAHESEPVRAVAVEVRAAEAGAVTLTVRHGPHGDDAAGLKARAAHREGWEYFLPQLPAALAGPG
jgi:uncharacterized protein YndB with AHSA1/START domain